MPPAGFDLAIPATDQPQTYALDRAATGIGPYIAEELEIINWDKTPRPHFKPIKSFKIDTSALVNSYV
jgi:hypothetical protein